MPRKVTISAEVGVLMNTSSVPAPLAYCREWARKMLRLQKPEPCVDFTAGPAWAVPASMPMLMVLAAAAPFRNRRRDGRAVPEKSISESLGKCVQPMRSHMTCPPRGGDLEERDLACRCLALTNSLPAVVPRQPSPNCRHANRREPPMRPALRRIRASAVPVAFLPTLSVGRCRRLRRRRGHEHQYCRL